MKNQDRVVKWLSSPDGEAWINSHFRQTWSDSLYSLKQDHPSRSCWLCKVRGPAAESRTTYTWSPGDPHL